MDEKIPELYETEEIELEKKMIYQKWDIEEIGFYWLIVELDKKKNFAFGYANLNNDYFAEWGYINIRELVSNGAEQDRRLARNLYEAKYQLWKRHNISELIEEYKKDNRSKGNFERFCREMLRKGWDKSFFDIFIKNVELLIKFIPFSGYSILH